MSHDADDAPIGRILSRREILAVLGGAGAALATGGARPRRAGAQTRPTGSASPLPSCIVRPAQTEGPYFVDERLERADIRSDPSDGSVRPGTPLSITFRVSRLDGDACTPLAGAYVDLWQCDAAGEYSGVSDMNGYFDTRGRKFLRGAQRTDAAGAASFRTIYPGWYQGRAVHVHFKIRTDPDARRGYSFASQLYFDEDLTDRVYRAEPYAARDGARRRRNEQDGIFRQGGRQLILALERSGDGYAGAFDVGLAIR